MSRPSLPLSATTLLNRIEFVVEAILVSIPIGLLFTLVVFVSPPVGACRSEKAGSELHQFAIAISAANKSVKSGTKIIVEVALTNISGFTVGLPAGDREAPWYTIEVSRKDGSMVQPSNKKPRESAVPLPPGTFEVDNYSGIMGQLKAGETLKEKVVISDLYDLHRPGRYSVTARRAGESSNSIWITITR